MHAEVDITSDEWDIRRMDIKHLIMATQEHIHGYRDIDLPIDFERQESVEYLLNCCWLHSFDLLCEEYQ